MLSEAKTTEYLELVKQLREWPSHSDRQWAVECGQAADVIESLLACIADASKELQGLRDEVRAFGVPSEPEKVGLSEFRYRCGDCGHYHSVHGRTGCFDCDCQEYRAA